MIPNGLGSAAARIAIHCSAWFSRALSTGPGLLEPLERRLAFTGRRVWKQQLDSQGSLDLQEILDKPIPNVDPAHAQIHRLLT